MFRAAMDRDPIFASMLGLSGWDDRVEDLGADGEQELRARLAGILVRAETSDEDPVTLAVVRHQATAIINQIDARLVEHTVAEGLAAPVNRLLTMAPQVDMSKRLHLLPRFLGQAGERLLDAERRPLRRHLRSSADRIAGLLAGSVQPWEGEADLRPAFARFREVLLSVDGRDDEQPGLCWLPEGEANYLKLVGDYTTTSHTPAELHRLGLDLLARLREEYAEVGARVWGTTDVPEIFRRLRTELLWDNENDMVTSAADAIARAEAVAPRWFSRLPSAGCEVRLVEESERATAPIAYYLEVPRDGSRPGTYWLNPLGATERSRTQAETTAFHEGVPGHHLQTTLAAETDLPDLRKYASIDAYLEGWGLYAERLADEMGLYSSQEQRLGMLSADAMRAARLVVDTGLHAFGWSRQQAVDHLRENTVMPEPEIQSEVDRYIEVPGQALAYMVGRIEIQRLRSEAEAALGERFDVRAFHDLVVGTGPVPLSTLGDLVREYVGAGR
ncbi:hypothetical protein ADL03_34975 [Nocardia sp. NRRL S-836]|nr:hypothetical protein ADL03_34975 [Nocardia sp. NRRL S-836]